MTFRTWKGGTEGSSLLCFVSENLSSRILRKNIPQSRFGRGEDVETRRKHTQKWSYGRHWVRFSSFSNPPHVGLTCHTWHHWWHHRWQHHSYGIFSRCKFLDHRYHQLFIMIRLYLVLIFSFKLLKKIVQNFVYLIFFK